jgi:predicted dehydrogenase
MTNQARIGLIGAGWWAVANHLPLLKANPDCQVVAVNRLGRDELAKVQGAFDVPQAFEDYRTMLDEVKLDGVVVASPHVLHHEHASAALARGCHVLIEKPMTTTAADARDLVAQAQAMGRQIVVAYGWNFADWCERAHALVVEGAIGRVEHVVVQMASALEDLFAGQPMLETEGQMFRPPPSTWADPERAGGYAWGQLTHALGLLFRIAPLLPEQVFAATGASPAGVDYYDAAVLRFAGGVTGIASGAATVPKHRGFQLDLRLFGSEGMLLLDIERERLEVRRRDRQDIVVPMRPGDGAYACKAPLDRLVAFCRGENGTNPADGIVGMRAVEVLEALHRSAASGRMESV